MKSALTINWIGVASYAVGFLALIFIIAVLSGRKIPLLDANGKAAFIILFVFGFAMSVLGGFRDYPDGKFGLPVPILNILMFLGFAAIAFFVITLIGIKIPRIPTYRESFIVMSGIIIIKLVVVNLYKLYKLF